MSAARVSFTNSYEVSVRLGKWLPYIEAAKLLKRDTWMRIEAQYMDQEKARNGLYHAARLRGMRAEIRRDCGAIFLRVRTGAA